MGKRGQWSAEEWDAWRSSHGQPSGGWHRQKGKAKEGKGDNPRKGADTHRDRRQNTFPSFETMEAGSSSTRSTTKPKDSMEIDDEAPSNGQVTRGVQKVLNSLRKAEGKARRLAEDKAETQKKWAAWREELQQSFLKEKKRYQDRIDKITQELMEAEQAQEDALGELQMALLEPQALHRSKATTPEDPAALAEFEELLQSPEKRPNQGIADLITGAFAGGRMDKAERRQMLLEAIMEHKAARRQKTPPARRRRSPSPTTPPGDKPNPPTTRHQTGTEDTYSGNPEDAAKPAPFPASPSTMTTRPVPDGTARIKSRSSARIPVKQVGRTPSRPKSGASLAEKLEARRGIVDAGAIVESDEEIPIADLTGANTLDAGQPSSLRYGFFGLSGRREGDNTVLHPDGVRGLHETTGLEYPLFGHGPSGGHDPGDTRSRINYDILDLFADAIDYLGVGLIQFGEEWRASGSGFCCSLILIQFGALLSMLKVRPCGCSGGPYRPTRNPFLMAARVLLIFGLLSPSMAATTDDGPPRPPRNGGHNSLGFPAIPRQTDLELWASGQLTAREQMLNAYDAYVAGLPLAHFEGEMAPPNITVAAVAEPGDHTTPAWDERRAVHVTVWVAAPHFATEVVDLGIAFPLSEQRLCDAVKGTCVNMPDYFETILPTVPQIGSHYGSCLAVPSWLPGAGKTALVMDSRGIGGEIFPFILDGPLTKRALTKQLPDEADPVDLYLFGNAMPMAGEGEYQTVQGGVIKAFYEGSHCTWEGHLSERLEDPSHWNPMLNPPGTNDAPHVVYQSPEDQLVYYDIPGAEENRLELAESLLGYASGQCWICEPTHPAEDLTHAGRRVQKQIAVMPGPRSTHEDDPDATVIFVDLRGLGLFPQWLLLPGQLFNSAEYLEGIQAPIVDGWTVVVEGGELTNNPELLMVNHCETLNFFLKETGELTPMRIKTRAMTAAAREMFFRTPQTFRRAHRQRDQGHSGHQGPRRSMTEAGPQGEERFDLTREALPLPENEQQIRALLGVWPPDWMAFDVKTLSLQSATTEALDTLLHWSQLVRQPSRPRVHIYTDGSYKASSRTSGAGIVILLELGTMLALYGIVGEPILGSDTQVWGDSHAPALHAEQVAIAIALLWAGQSLHFLRPSGYTIHFDCQAAGWATDGTFACCNELAVQSRNLEMYLQEVTHHGLQFEYVQAHCSHAWNELADSVAKAAAAQHTDLPCPPPEVPSLFLRMDLSWMAAILHGCRHQALPIVGHNLVWDPTIPSGPSPLQPQDLIPTHSDRVGQPDGPSLFSTRIATVNVQGLGGKRRYLSDQFQEHHLQIIFLQETKDSEGVCKTADYLRIQTASDSHWGVGIWLNAVRGFCTIDGAPLIAAEEDIQIVCHSPKLLLLVVRKLQRRFILFAGHCPHSGRPTERESFLDELASRLRAVGPAALLLGGLDLNGKLPPNLPDVTGNLQHGDPDTAGQQLGGLLSEIGAWIPATYEELHVGPTTTYVHPCGTESRIDYCILGGTLRTTRVCSWSDGEIDTGNKQEDHRPACVAILKAPSLVPVTSLNYDGHVLTDRNYRHLPARFSLQRQCGHMSPQPGTPMWTPIASTSRTTSLLSSPLFPAPVHGRRATYIPDHVWQWRDTKIRLKKRTAHRRGLWKNLLARAFRKWATGAPGNLEEEIATQGLFYELSATAIGYVTANIKRGIYQAKDGFLKELIADGVRSTTDLLRKMKLHGVGGRKARAHTRPLPILLDATGEAVTCRADRDDLWLRHFSAQEIGTVLSVTDFLSAETAKCAGVEEIEWSFANMPTPVQLEQLLRMAPKGKSPCIDGIPGEALRAAPSALGRAMYPLIAKSVLTVQQPIQWRGGILYAAYKGKGLASDPENHRSLYVSSLLGKTYHRLLRDQAHGALQDTLHGLHLRSKRQAPIQFASLYLLSLFRAGVRGKRSIGALFLDSRAAYYRVAREVAMGPICDDNSVARVFKHFDLDGEDIHELYHLIRAGGLMTEAGAPSMTTAAVRDLHHRTRAISAYSIGEALASSQAGSRPGESFADAIFSFVYARVLGQITEILDGEGVLWYMKYDSAVGAFGGNDEGTPHLIRDATWADDSSFPFEDDCPWRFVRKAQGISAVVISKCQSFGMDPNLAPGKTALVLSLRGKGSQATRRHFFAEAQYTHLGGVLDMNANGKAESSLALAQSSYDSGRRLVYQNKMLPLSTRAKLFEVSVLPSIFNLSQWVPRGEAWTRLALGYTRIVRNLLIPHVPDDRLFHVPSTLIYKATGCWRLELHARKARLSLLVSLIIAGPEVLWGVLQTEREWLYTVRDDLCQLRADQPHWPPIQDVSWPQWWHQIRESPSRFKLGVKKMLRRQHEKMMGMEIQCLALWSLSRQATLPGTTQGRQEDRWTCRHCQCGFKKKANLSVHFFKTHGRVARHRQCVVGTYCVACGGQYRSQARLQAHLASSPNCVDYLIRLGRTTSTPLPGRGSNQWRKTSATQFTWQPVSYDGEIADPVYLADRELPWDETPLKAYKRLCEALSEGDQGRTVRQLREEIRTVLAQHPLYREEEELIVEHTAKEIAMLQADELFRGDYHNIEVVLRDRDSLLHFTPRLHSVPDHGLETFREFDRHADAFDWTALVHDCQRRCGTLEQVHVMLDAGWEAEDPVLSCTWETSAALVRPILLVPSQVRKAWTQVLEAGTAVVSAPESFWSSRLSAPFRALRASLQS
ncbi:unnamed protein product [Symbiodinium sp. CCMP2592]|nr:unnamed protein product [Symbiodinium sp. CCMP2592]